jgi:uncharacterized membrane protein/outer membrane protein assembly factor BamB
MNAAKRKTFFVSAIIVLLMGAVVVGVVQNLWSDGVNNELSVGPTIDIPDNNPDEQDNFEPEAAGDSGSNARAGKGGTLKWHYVVGDEELSTPAICDLDPPISGGEAFYEVVVGSADDKVCAFDKAGKLKWEFNDCVIDNAGALSQGLDFDPPDFFSSVTPVDIAGGKGEELIIGEQDGVLCLSPDGTVLWKDKGATDGYYFSSIAVCDLEGDYMGIDADGNDVGYRDDLEIILGSDNQQNADAFIECWQANSNDVFRHELPASEHAFMTCSIVAAELDGHFYESDEHLEWIRENDPDTLYTDILGSTHDWCGRIWSHVENGEWNQYYERSNKVRGHETYSTPAVGNYTGDPQLECIVGSGTGAMSWETSSGKVVMYHQDGNEIVPEFSTGSAPSSVFSSPSVCDAQNLDEKDLDDDEIIEYEVYFGCDNGIFYCLSATDLNDLWSYKTGGRILSSPAVCNINSDDRLEVIIGSNDGIVYCFEADPEELDRDGEPNPKDDGIEDGGGESGAYDILWMYDTKEIEGASGEIGISSPVVGDIDRDGSLEVLIGDTAGILYCINAGGKCVPGQVDWPMFHSDLNKTGVYRPGEVSGVKVDRGIMKRNNEEFPEDLSKSVRPGETVSYNVTVQNIGTSKTFTDVDTYWLSMEQLVYKYGDPIPDHEWPAPVLMGKELRWGSPTGSSAIKPYIILMSMQKINLTINLTAPWSGDLSELCLVKLVAQSENNTFAKDDILTKTSLEITLDFDISILKEPVTDKEDELYGQKIVKINPSDETVVEVRIRNRGSLNDTYNLEIKGHQYFPDWDAYFLEVESDNYPNALQLDAPIMEDQFPIKFGGSEGELRFKIKAPPDAQVNELLTIKVLATSVYSTNTEYLQNITKFDHIFVLVNPIPDLELKCREPRQYVSAGSNVTYKVEILNRGNTKIYVKLEHSQLEEGWTIALKDEDNNYLTGQEITIDVLKDSVTNLYVMIGAPRNSQAGSKQNIVIKGTTTNDPTLVSTDSVALTAVVKQFFDINVSITPESMLVDPGSTIFYNITIDNVGNGKDFVIITPTMLEVNWESTFYLGKNERVTSELKLNESVVFKMQIKIPRNQLAGKFPIGVNISSIGDYEMLKVYVDINKIFNLSVYGVEHSDVTGDKRLNDTINPVPGVSPKSVLNLIFEVTNGGNDADWIQVNLEPLMAPNARQSGSGLSPVDWSEFEELGWKVYFIGVANSEVYLTDLESIDFNEDIDLSPLKAPTGYINDVDETVRSLKLRLGVGQTIWLRVQMIVPKNVPYDESGDEEHGQWHFLLNSVTTDPNGKNKDVDMTNNEVWVKLNVLLPDLQVVGKIHHPSSITNGEIVTISSEIRNIGDISAKDVVITFYVDGKEVKSQTINHLDKGRSRLIPFTWLASAGDHDLKVEIDPDNEIVELRENNNEKTAEVKVDEQSMLDIVSTREVCSVIAIIIVLIILAIVLTIMKKKGSFFGLRIKREEEG